MKRLIQGRQAEKAKGKHSFLNRKSKPDRALGAGIRVGQGSHDGPGELPGASLPDCTGDLHGLASVGRGRLGEGAGPRPGLPRGALGQGPTCRRCVPPGGAAASTGPRAPAHWAPRPPSTRTWVAPSPSVWSAGRTASSGLQISSTGRCWARAASARPSRCGARWGGRGPSGGDLLALHPLPTSVPMKPHWKDVWLLYSLASAHLPSGPCRASWQRGPSVYR